MYNSEEIAKRIKETAKEKEISVSEMLNSCGLGKNTISKMMSGNDILTKNFAKMAEYLDCSADYLLGRTDNPNVNTAKEQAAELNITPEEIHNIQAYEDNIAGIAAESGKKYTAEQPDLDTIIDIEDDMF